MNFPNEQFRKYRMYSYVSQQLKRAIGVQWEIAEAWKWHEETLRREMVKKASGKLPFKLLYAAHTVPDYRRVLEDCYQNAPGLLRRRTRL